jgi:hypothetical protein
MENPNVRLDQPKEIVEEIAGLADIYWKVFTVGITRSISSPKSPAISQIGNKFISKADAEMIIDFFNTIEGMQLALYHKVATTHANKAMIDYLMKAIQLDPIKFERLAPNFSTFVLNRGTNG